MSRGADGSFYSERPVQKGRRDYVCNFCRKPIPSGVAHVCVSASDGERGGTWSVRAHAACLAHANGGATRDFFEIAAS